MVRPVNRVRPALLLWVLLLGCKEHPPATVTAPQTLDAPSRPAQWVLTLPMLDGYLRYQRTLLVQAGKLAPPPWDGGLKPFVEPTVEEKAELDERSRREGGLTTDDVEKIEQMVSVLASRRLAARTSGEEAPMPPGLARAPDDTMPRPKSKSLDDERRRFGDASIDVLLKREAEVLKNWSLLMGLPEEKTR
jgi:hypothetical protein